MIFGAKRQSIMEKPARKSASKALKNLCNLCNLWIPFFLNRQRSMNVDPS